MLRPYVARQPPTPASIHMRPIVYSLLLLVCPTAGATQSFDFYARGPYRPAVPRPEAITGYAAGDQHTMYAVMQHYLDTLVATAPERRRCRDNVEIGRAHV